MRLRFQRRQTVASVDEDLDLNASGNISLSPGPEGAAAADDVAPATEEPQRAEPFDLNGDDEVSDLNVTFAISLEDNEHMEKGA